MLLFFRHFTIQSLQHWFFNHLLSFFSLYVVLHLLVYYFVVWTYFTHPLSLFICNFPLNRVNQWSAIRWNLFRRLQMSIQTSQFVMVSQYLPICLKTVFFVVQNVVFQSLAHLQPDIFLVIRSFTYCV